MSGYRHLSYGSFGGMIALAAACAAMAQAPAPPVLPAANTATASSSNPEPLPETIPSLVFSPEDMQKIRQVMEAYHNRANEPEIMQNLGIVSDTPKAEKPSIVYYPQFYLDSIVYHDDTSWIVWINRYKFTPEQKQQDRLEIIEVARSYVRLRWKPASMQRILQQYKVTHNEGIEVEEDVVVFKLYINQTFASHDLSIIEGRQAPVAIESTSLTNELGQKPKEEPTDASKPGNKDKEKTPDKDLGNLGKSNEGLTGLINRYERMNKVDPMPSHSR